MKTRLLLTEHDYRSLSISRLLRVRLRTLLKFIWLFLHHPYRRWKRLSRLKELRGSHRDATCLVLGLGPSINSLSAPTLRHLRSRGDFKVIAVNAFSETRLAKDMVPDFYVLTDPAYFGRSLEHYQSTSRADPSDVWEYLGKNTRILVFVPHDVSVPSGIPDHRVYYINTLGLQGFTKSIAPHRPRGYLSITSYAALALAGEMGFKRILISGIENSQFQRVALSSRGKVSMASAHAYNFGDDSRREIALFDRGGIAAFFEDVARLFGDLHMFSHLPIENLHRETLIDAFPVAKDFTNFLSGEVEQ